jgi:3-oxoisoapionate decarboxylase
MSSEQHLSRRRFLSLPGTAGAIGLGAWIAGCASQGRGASPGHTAGRRPLSRRSRPAARLGLDTYSLHRCLTASDPALKRDLWWVVEQLEALKLTGLQIDPSHFPGLEEETLSRLEAATLPRGYYVEFGMGGWGVDRMEQRIKLTARFGGRALRTFCGGEGCGPERIALYLEAAPPELHKAGDIAERYGVPIAVENHGDFTIAEMKELLERTDHPWVGVCFDTGNALFRNEDPWEAARELLPYSFSMHLKDWTMTPQADGPPHWKEAVLGQGQVPIRDILELTVKTRPGLYIALETPVQPSDDEKETVEREWRHVQACAEVANRYLTELRAL